MNMEINYNLKKSKRRESLSNTRRKSIVSVDDLPLNYKPKRKAEDDTGPKPKRKSSVYISSLPESLPSSSSTSHSSVSPDSSSSSSTPPPVNYSSQSPSYASTSSAPSSSSTSSTAAFSSSAPVSSFPSTSSVPPSSSSSQSSSSSSSSTRPVPVPTNASAPKSKPVAKKSKPAPIPASPIPETIRVMDDVQFIKGIVKDKLKQIGTDHPLFLEYKKMGHVFVNCAVACDYGSTQPTKREQLEAKERQLQNLIKTWEKEEKAWDQLLAKHHKQQTKFQKISDNINQSNKKNKSNKQKDKGNGDDMMAKVRQYVVELEKLKPHLSELENYISSVQTKLTTVASDIQHSAISSTPDDPQSLIRNFTSH